MMEINLEAELKMLSKKEKKNLESLKNFVVKINSEVLGEMSILHLITNNVTIFERRLQEKLAQYEIDKITRDFIFDLIMEQFQKSRPAVTGKEIYKSLRAYFDQSLEISIEALKSLVQAFVEAGLNYTTRGNQEQRNEIFNKLNKRNISTYLGFPDKRLQDLIRISFHPTLPLVALNYTDTFFMGGLKERHLTGSTDKEWNLPMRLCRGIIFETVDPYSLVAFPYKKFFNLSLDEKNPEHPEAYIGNLNWRKGYTVTEKYDGYLIIACNYKDKLIVSTRGSFETPQAKLAKGIIEESGFYVEPRCTHMFELISKDSSVLVDYGEDIQLILHGIRKGTKLLPYSELKKYFELNLNESPVEFQLLIKLKKVSKLRGKKTLEKYLLNPKFKNEEGLVLEFPGELLVKVKSKGYLELFRAARKLTWKNVAKTILNIKTYEHFENLPEELIPAHHEMADYLIKKKEAVEHILEKLVFDFNDERNIINFKLEFSGPDIKVDVDKLNLNIQKMAQLLQTRKKYAKKTFTSTVKKIILELARSLDKRKIGIFGFTGNNS